MTTTVGIPLQVCDVSAFVRDGALTIDLNYSCMSAPPHTMQPRFLHWIWYFSCRGWVWYTSLWAHLTTLATSAHESVVQIFRSLPSWMWFSRCVCMQCTRTEKVDIMACFSDPPKELCLQLLSFSSCLSSVCMFCATFDIEELNYSYARWICGQFFSIPEISHREHAWCSSRFTLPQKWPCSNPLSLYRLASPCRGVL